MTNRDINLFKAAGGERAKGTKRSPMTYMVMFAIFVIVVSVGLLVYLNMNANKAVADYDAAKGVAERYGNVKRYVTTLAKEYEKVKNDIDSAAAINQYSEASSNLYPKLTPNELNAVKNAIVNNPVGEFFSLNDPEEDEPFTAWDYAGLRESLYNGEISVDEVEDRALFYFALEKLADAQKKSPKTNVWYAYYRCYLVMVFTGGDGMGLASLGTALLNNSEPMLGEAPFLTLQMSNAFYYDGVYSPAKYLTHSYNDVNYNVVLMPIKSVLERAVDILEAHTAAVVEANGWQYQRELAAYSLDDISFTNEKLSFTLTLPTKTNSFTACMDAFDYSYFFRVNEEVARFDSDSEGALTEYKVVLDYYDSETGRIKG